MEMAATATPPSIFKPPVNFPDKDSLEQAADKTVGFRISDVFIIVPCG